MSKFKGMNMEQLARFATETQAISSADWHDYANAVICVSFKERQELIDKNSILKDRCSDLIEDLFLELADEISDESSDRFGWFDTMAKSDAVRYGDELVELGVYERHPDGYGRRWFYRPIKEVK